MKFAVNVPSHDLAKEQQLEGMEQIIPIHVDATSKQEAINKALQITGGTEWHSVTQLDEEAPPPASKIRREGNPHQPDTIRIDGRIDTTKLDATPNKFPTRIANTMGLTANGIVDLAAPKQDEEEPGLWAEPWKPQVFEGEEITLSTIVGQAIGTGSMCWKETPTGVFDSERAAWVRGGAINEIEKLIFRQTAKDHGRNATSAYEFVNGCDAKACADEPVTGMAEEPAEAREWRIQRNADKAAVVDLILSYRNEVSDEDKLRQIRVVMD